MNRITEIEISGTKVPLNFSVWAASQIYERFGDISGMQEAVTNGFTEKSIQETLWVLGLLAEQGRAYEKIRNGRETEPFSAEGLEVLLGIHEFNEVRSKIFEAVSKSVMPTVETKPPKNAEATQGKAALRGFGFTDVFSGFRKKQ